VPRSRIALDDPRAADVQRLLARHLAFAHEFSPPQDVHALDLAGLLDPAVTLFSFRQEGELLALGALKQLDDEHAELKSMHTVESARRQGIGRAMVEHLISEARKRGFRRLSLETGTMSAYDAARSLYANSGFIPCNAYGDYIESPNSCFMTLRLEDRPTVDS
jgi:putative acetyltransferase